jgi:hypothetical protein
MRSDPPKSHIPTVPGARGPDSMSVVMGKVASDRLGALGNRGPAHQYLALANRSRSSSEFTIPVSDQWRLHVKTDHAGGTGGCVSVQFRTAAGKWLDQNPPDNSPAKVFVSRGVDPTGLDCNYHFVERVTYLSLGRQWDPDPNTPSEICWSSSGEILWQRRMFDGRPADRSDSLPALESFWPGGSRQLFRYANPEALSAADGKNRPFYGEFYPNDTPAVHVFPGGIIRAFLPDGSTAEDSVVVPPATSISRTMHSSTPVDFDPENLRPYPSFLDEFPDGSHRLHRSLIPPSKEGILRWDQVSKTRPPIELKKGSILSKNPPSSHDNSPSLTGRV